MSILGLTDTPVPSRCKDCGAAMSPSAKFCGECGTTQPSQAAQAATASTTRKRASFAPEDTTANPVEEHASQDPPPRSARLKSVLTGLVIGAPLLAIVAGVLIVSNSASGNAPGHGSAGSSTTQASVPPSPSPTTTAPQDEAPQLSEAEFKEKWRRGEKNSVRSNLTCKSSFPLKDGRPFVMDVVKKGDELLVSGFAVNGPDQYDHVWSASFSQNNEGMWASYSDAESIKMILMFTPNGKETQWSLSVTRYSDNGYSDNADQSFHTGECEDALSTEAVR